MPTKKKAARSKPIHGFADPAPIEVSDTGSFRKKLLIPSFFIANNFLVPKSGNVGGTIFAATFQAVSITVNGINSPPPPVLLNPTTPWRVVLNRTVTLTSNDDVFVDMDFDSANVASANPGRVKFGDSLMRIRAFVSGKKQFDVSVAQPTAGFGVTIQYCPGGICS
jgi:hypothetical protein